MPRCDSDIISANFLLASKRAKKPARWAGFFIHCSELATAGERASSRTKFRTGQPYCLPSCRA